MALIAIVSTGCSLNDSISGPQVEQDPFEAFDRISPPVPGPGIRIPSGGILGDAPSHQSTKPIGTPKTVSRQISARRGGSIFVANLPTLARLTVLRGAMDEDTTIDMTVLGSTGSIGLTFGPDGLTFSPSAVLDIVRPIGDLDPDDLQLYLTSADGSVEELKVEVLRLGSWMRVRTWVSHFSAVGDEEDDEAYDDDPNPES
jgi:hypothetical protein